MRSPFSALSALLVGTGIFVMATGLLGTSLALRAANAFPQWVTGIVMAAYFVGFVLGTYLCPRIVSRAGHARAFSVFAAVAAAAVLFHAMTLNPLAWGLLRLLSGACVVGLYLVVESWLNEKAASEARGRVFALYQIISLASLALGQWLLLLERDAASNTPFLICGALFSLGLVPIALTRIREPEPIEAPSLEPGFLWKVSPLGVLGTFMAALANGSFFALGPVYAQSAGMNTLQVATFMSLVILGGVALQWPIGRLSDRMDRRTVILMASILGAVAAGLSAVAAGRWALAFLPLSFLYGGVAFSLYPLCVAHSNDHVSAAELVRTASGLLLVYGVGAAAGPVLAGAIMARAGGQSFFLVLAGVQAALAVAVVFRSLRRPAPAMEEQEPFVMITRTSPSALSMLPEAVEQAEARPPSVQESDNPVQGMPAAAEPSGGNGSGAQSDSAGR